MLRRLDQNNDIWPLAFPATKTSSSESTPRGCAAILFAILVLINDEQLTEALQYELGKMGGATGGSVGVTYQGSELKIWADRRVRSRLRPPILEGQATLRLARKVYGTADPDEKQISLFSSA
jgi:hypothetical protein